MLRRTTTACLCALLIAAKAAALDVHVKEVRAPSGAVRVALELRDVLPDRFKRVVDEGGVLHLRVQAELWESRPVWDRLVYPAMSRVFRLARVLSASGMSVTDQAGAVSTYAEVPNPMPVVVELGKADRVSASERYYVRVIATLGTLADREANEVGDAVFGDDSASNGLGALGRMVFQKMIEIGDYMQSVSAETKSRVMAGRDILAR
jgi:hypothetical protein